MKTSTKLVSLAATAGLAIATISGAPASADPVGQTVATFALAAGTLDITVPATSNLGTVASGSDSVSASLGAVQVIDERAALDAGWTVTVASSDFTTGGATEPETVPADEVDYNAGSPTATTGTGTFTPSGAQAGIADPGATAFTHTDGSGNNSASWNPTITVNLAGDQVAGPYTGTITHSVA